MTNHEKIMTQMKKGVLEYLILRIIHDGDVYASLILDQLHKSQLLIVEGTLYPLLSRLNKEGVLGYKWIESHQGPPRKYYHLTSQGKELLYIMEESWEKIQQAVTIIRKKEK